MYRAHVKEVEQGYPPPWCMGSGSKAHERHHGRVEVRGTRYAISRSTHISARGTYYRRTGYDMYLKSCTGLCEGLGLASLALFYPQPNRLGIVLCRYDLVVLMGNAGRYLMFKSKGLGIVWRVLH